MRCDLERSGPFLHIRRRARPLFRRLTFRPVLAFRITVLKTVVLYIFSFQFCIEFSHLFYFSEILVRTAKKLEEATWRLACSKAKASLSSWSRTRLGLAGLQESHAPVCVPACPVQACAGPPSLSLFASRWNRRLRRISHESCIAAQARSSTCYGCRRECVPCCLSLRPRCPLAPCSVLSSMMGACCSPARRRRRAPALLLCRLPMIPSG